MAQFHWPPRQEAETTGCVCGPWRQWASELTSLLGGAQDQGSDILRSVGMNSCNFWAVSLRLKPLGRGGWCQAWLVGRCAGTGVACRVQGVLDKERVLLGCEGVKNNSDDQEQCFRFAGTL